MGLSPAIMGVTVLAWGNSIGDLVADVALARAGEPVVALAGCYAGPMFNMLIGLGLALTIKTAFMYPQPYGMQHLSHCTILLLDSNLAGTLPDSLTPYVRTCGFAACSSGATDLSCS